MINVGIKTSSIALQVAPYYKGNRSERLKESWQAVKKILACCCNSGDRLLIDDLGICPNCSTEEYLVVSDPCVSCLNCGTKWVVIDDGKQFMEWE